MCKLVKKTCPGGWNGKHNVNGNRWIRATQRWGVTLPDGAGGEFIMFFKRKRDAVAFLEYAPEYKGGDPELGWFNWLNRLGKSLPDRYMGEA